MYAGTDLKTAATLHQQSGLEIATLDCIDVGIVRSEAGMQDPGPLQ